MGGKEGHECSRLCNVDMAKQEGGVLCTDESARVNDQIEHVDDGGRRLAWQCALSHPPL